VETRHPLLAGRRLERMNKTNTLVILLLFQEDAGSVILAKEKTLHPRPTLVNISFQKFVPANS
jgi:hypothetical protein